MLGMSPHSTGKLTFPHVKEVAKGNVLLCLRKLKQGLWVNLEGWGGAGDRRGFRREGTHVYLWAIHVDVW